MPNRNVPLVVCLALVSGAALAQNPQGVGYAVEFAPTDSGPFQVFPESTATFANSNIANTGPSGTSQLVAKPDGSKFYIVGSSGLDSIDPAFATPKAVNGLTGTLTHGTMTPDGRFLFVSASQGSGAGNVYILNTANDSVVLNQPVNGSVIGVVISRDSSTAWILGESSATFVTTITLPTNIGSVQQVGQPYLLRDPTTGNSLAGDATSFTLSPLGLLYVTAGNQILQIDPTVLDTTCQTSPLTCSPATVAQINATPGPLQYTPDGVYAYFLNQTPTIGGQSLLRLTLPITGGNANLKVFRSTEVFDSVMVAGQNRIFAHSPSDSTLWDVAGDLSTVTVSSLQTVLPATQVFSAVISGEVPSSQYLFVLAGGSSLANVFLVNLSTNAVSAQAASSLGLGAMQYIFVPSQTPPAFSATPLTYNATQTNLAPGATAAPLIARVLDQNGLPVFNVPVSFTGDPSLVIKPANTTTNADGYVQAIVTVGTTPGSYPVTMTAGTGNNTVTATFSLAIPGAGTPGGPGGGPNQLSIITGNGQLFQSGVLQFGSPNNLLTVQLLDTSGNPLANQNVTFTVTGAAIGTVGNPNTSTDDNGFANSTFFPGFPGQAAAFQSTSVVATATDVSGNVLGSVTFTETIYQVDSFGGGPTISIQQPVTSVIAGGEGDVIPGAIQAALFTNAFGRGQAIPGVGIRIADATDPNNNGAGSCQGAPLSDQNGVITCNFIPACATSITASGAQLGLGLHGFDIVIGEHASFTNYGVNILPGSTQTVVATGGNNQNGNPGAILATPLTATVTDKCGTPIAGVNITWKVTQGAGSLSTTSTQTGAGGFGSTKLTLGTGGGTTVQVTASINGGASATFKETVNVVAGSLTLTQGGGQSLKEGQQFQPLVFTLKDTSGTVIPGAPVTFSLAAGSAAASLGSESSQTNAQGQASVTVTAGNAPGTITVSVTADGLNSSATLTVTAPGPSVTSTSFVNAASLQAGLVPCGLATVTGSGLAPNVTGVVSGNTLGIGPLPYTLQGVSISVNLVAAPILSVSNQGGIQQVNFQTPCEVQPTSSGTVVVQVNSAITTVTGVTIYPTQPGIVTYAGPAGTSYGWIISAKDGSYLTPSNPAHVGQTYYLVATGLGQTTPAAQTNAPGTGSQTIAASQVVLAIDNVGVPVTSVQYLQGSVGVYIITFTIPNTINNGQPFPTGTNVPVTLGGITPAGQTIYDNAPVAIPSVQ